LTEVQRVVKAVRDVRTSPSDRIVRASALIALGIGCAGAALGFALGVGSTGTATVSVFGIRLEEVPSAWVAAVAAVLAVVATLLTARGWRTIWGRGRAKEELSVQAEALRIRRSLLEARVLELEGEVAELERRIYLQTVAAELYETISADVQVEMADVRAYYRSHQDEYLQADGSVAELWAVKDSIREDLIKQAKDEAFGAWLDEARAGADVVVVMDGWWKGLT